MLGLKEENYGLFKIKRFNLLAFGIIVGLILIAYSNTFTASFHFDDNPAIVENSGIKRLTWENFMGAFSGTRWVVNLSLLFNYTVSGLNVVGWHIFNISLHIVNTLLVYLILLWTLMLPSLNQRYGARARRMALFGALLFGVHPIQTESVTYIISRTELIAAFFFLSTVLFFIKQATTGKFRYSFFAFISAFLAMGSKEWAVTLPAIILLYDFLFIAEGKPKDVLSRWKTHVLVMLTWGELVYTMSTNTMSGAGFGVVGQNNITPLSYMFTSFNVLWTYIRLLLVPINQNLDYQYHWSRSLFEFPTYLSLLGHIGVIAAGFWTYWKKRWTLVPFGIAWFYINLSPTQSFVPILDVIFEHRLYLPSVGFFIVFVAFFESIFDLMEMKSISRKADVPSV